MTLEIEDKISEDVVIAAPEEPVVEPVLSLRDALVKARDEVKEEPEISKEKKPLKSKNLDVKAIKKDDVVEAKVEPEEVIKMPKSFSAALQPKWTELPKEVQKELAKREEETHREFTRMDEDRNLGKQINTIVQPYMAHIRAEGADAPQAIASLLNMAHVLRVGTPQQKSDLLLRTAQAYGVDLRQNTQQGQPPVHPMLQQMAQKVETLESRIAQEKALQKQQEDNATQQIISTFSADPKNVHFDAVKAHMASLLQSGLAKDLQDAYDQAVYANPQTRSTLLSAHSQNEQEKRVNEQKARAEAAKKAGSSIKGSPGVAASKNGRIQFKDLNSTIRAAMAESRGEA